MTVQSTEQIGVFLDGMSSFCHSFHIDIYVYEDCQAQFDFTQHTREDCDGKCWKSVDFIDASRFENYTRNRSLSLFRHTSLSNLKSSRRCFSANELIRAAEMGVNTSDGCRQVKRDHKKMKEVCFCSDQDMCNMSLKLGNNLFILIISTFSYVFK